MTYDRLSDDQLFAVGEIAIVAVATNFPENQGKECLVIGALEIRTCCINGDTAPRYRIEIGGKPFIARPCQLRKKPPPAREDQQVTTWEKCAWKPKQVRA